MVGSTIIHEPDAERLNEIETVEDLDRFTTVDLDVLTTLDFQEMVEAMDGNPQWADDDALIFDEGAGLAIFRVHASGLKAILAIESALHPDKRRDIDALQAFVDRHGFDDIYELATF
jgi:hypothetical protein